MRIELLFKFSLLLILFSIVAGCTTFQSNTSHIPIQTGLVSENDFGDEWTWPADQSGSFGPESITQSDQKIEKVSAYLFGKSKSANDGFLIQHRLFRYQQHLSSEYSDAIPEGDFDPGSEELMFDIQRMGIISQSKCLIAVTKLLYCKFRAKYKYVETEINMIGNWKRSQKDFEALVNETIIRLDEKIKLIDQPYSIVLPN